jgi:hypothetical protein
MEGKRVHTICTTVFYTILIMMVVSSLCKRVVWIRSHLLCGVNNVVCIVYMRDAEEEEEHRVSLDSNERYCCKSLPAIYRDILFLKWECNRLINAMDLRVLRVLSEWFSTHNFFLSPTLWSAHEAHSLTRQILVESQATPADIFSSVNWVGVFFFHMTHMTFSFRVALL